MEIEAPPPQSIEEALHELHARFLNLPKGEIPTVERIFFQIQQAHWYYEDEWADVYADDENFSLPHLRFEEFSKQIFSLSPMLREYCTLHADFKQRFKEYSASIPRYGAILVNAKMTHVLLVSNLSSKNYSFPKGKINQGEAGIDCAAREAYEETGYNPRSLLSESMAIVTENDNEYGFCKLYVAIGVPDDGTVIFSPVAKKEIGGIAWIDLNSIEHNKALAATDNGYKSVRAFGIGEHMHKLQSIFAKFKKGGKRKYNNYYSHNNNGTTTTTNSSNNPSSSTGNERKTNKTSSSNKHQNTTVIDYSTISKDTLLDIPLENKGKWKVNDMFQANAKILGVNFVYDGNPHTFGDESMNALPVMDNGNSGITTNTVGSKTVSTTKDRASTVTSGKESVINKKTNPTPNGKATTKKSSKYNNDNGKNSDTDSNVLAGANVRIALHDPFVFDHNAILEAMDI